MPNFRILISLLLTLGAVGRLPHFVKSLSLKVSITVIGFDPLLSQG